MGINCSCLTLNQLETSEHDLRKGSSSNLPSEKNIPDISSVKKKSNSDLQKSLYKNDRNTNKSRSFALNNFNLIQNPDCIDEKPNYIRSAQHLNESEIQNQMNVPTKRRLSALSNSSYRLGRDTFINIKRGKIGETYTTEKELGKGNYGKVLLVKHKTTGLQRALKSKKNFNKKSYSKRINC